MPSSAISPLTRAQTGRFIHAVTDQPINIGRSGNTIFLEAYLTATVTLEEETGLYVADCQALDLCSQGKTQEEAVKNIMEATELFIQSCVERGTLQEALTECGFHPTHEHIPAQRSAPDREATTPGGFHFGFPAVVPVMVYQ